MNLPFKHWQRVLTGLGSLALMAVSPAGLALSFQWQENALPDSEMELFGVAASPDRLLALGRIGTSPDSEPVAATSTDGLDWQIVDIGLAGRFGVDILHTDDGFIISLEDGSLRIGDLGDGGWNETTPPDEFRLQSPQLVEHEGRLLLFGRSESLANTSQIIATEDFASWETLYESLAVTSTTALANPVSTGSTMAMRVLPGPPSIPLNNLWFSTDGSNWEDFDGSGLAYLISALTARGAVLHAVAISPSGSDQSLQTLSRGSADADWQRIIHPELQIDSPGPIGGGAPGLVLRAIVDDQQALLTSIDGSSWTLQAFTPSGGIADFVAWRGGWVAVGETAVRGQPQGSVPVPAFSAGGLALLMLGLLLLGRLSLRRAG